MAIEKISDVIRRSRLRWMGHVLRKEGNDWVKKSMEMTVEGSRGRGRSKMTWEKVVERDMKVRGLVRNDVMDGVKCWKQKRLTATTVGKMASKCLFDVVCSRDTAHEVGWKQRGYLLFIWNFASCASLVAGGPMKARATTAQQLRAAVHPYSFK